MEITKRIIVRVALLTVTGFSSAFYSLAAIASTTDCLGVYVGRIWIEKGQGLFGAVFLNNPADLTGSYWQYFNDWTQEDRKAVLAVLTAAKVSQHRVDVTTAANGGCGIQITSQPMKSVFLSNAQ